MKAKMIITGDTTNQDFMALQSLCIEHGFTVTMALARDEVAKPVAAMKLTEKPNSSHGRGGNHYRLRDGRTCSSAIAEWLSGLPNKRVSRKVYEDKVLAFGFAQKTCGANLSRMIKANQVTMANDIIQLV